MIHLLKHFLLLTLFLSSLTFPSKAQYSQPLTDYVIEVWSANEGLPSNNLRHVAKDNEGFLWISTFNGLVRFDGNKFKTYDTKNVNNLSSSAFYSVNITTKGNMYISSQASGALGLDNGEISPIMHASELPNSVQTTYLDSKNRLWIGTRNAGVYFIENDKVVRFSISSFDNQSIMNFEEDELGNIWVASEGAGVARISGETIVVYNEKDGLVSNIVNAVFYQEGKMYVGTEKGLSIFQDESWVTDTRFDKIMINYIAEDVNRNLWFASDIGLARLSFDGKFEFMDEDNGLPSRQVSAIAFDDENNIWLSTKQGGLVQLKLSNFKNISPSDGLSYKVINVIEEDSNGTIYVGSDNGDIDVIRNGVISNLKLNKDLSNVSVKDILVEDDGTVWIATYDGVIKIKGGSEEYFKVDDGMLSLKSRRLLMDKEGVIWVASRNGGINKILKDGSVESISVDEGLGSDFAFSVDETPDGRILIGTANGGLDIIHKDGRIDILKPDSTLTGFSIFNIYIENDDRFWLASNVGLYCYQNNVFTLIDPKNGLAVETLFDIQEDKNGYLWATSILGLVRINKKEVLDLIDGKIDKINTVILDDSDGMISRECTGATSSLQSKDGKIWINTIEGISVLDPDNLVVNTKVPSVYIEDIIIDDNKIETQFYSENDGAQMVNIEPGHRNYNIGYTSLSMYSPEKVFFKYKLEGFDTEWIEVGPERQAKFTNLPYGNYTFKVLAANNNGVWSTNPASIDIIIEPYFYETKWFIVLLITVFIVFTFLIYTYQTKEVNHRNKELIKLNGELDSFAYSVSHDLKAPLTSIQGLLNVARLDDGKNALEFYSRIEESVDKLDSFIKDIIDYSKNARMDLKKESVHVKQLIEGLLDGLTYLSKEKEITISLNIAEGLEIFTDKTRFTFIVNNLVTNSIRYADLDKDSSYVTISAEVKGKYFILIIEDNGQGIKKELQDKIFEMFFRANEKSSGSGLGLYIVKESIHKLKGTLKLDSDLGVGTKVSVQIPL